MLTQIVIRQILPHSHLIHRMVCSVLREDHTQLNFCFLGTAPISSLSSSFVESYPPFAGGGVSKVTPTLYLGFFIFRHFPLVLDPRVFFVLPVSAVYIISVISPLVGSFCSFLLILLVVVFI